MKISIRIGGNPAGIRAVQSVTDDDDFFGSQNKG